MFNALKNSNIKLGGASLMSNAAAKQSQRMCLAVSSSKPQSLQTLLVARPILNMKYLKVQCPERRPVSSLKSVLLRRRINSVCLVEFVKNKRERE